MAEEQDALAQARSLIADRIAELDAERSRLAEALAKLDGRPEAEAKRQRKTGEGESAVRWIFNGKSTKAAQIMREIRETPGATAPEIAKRLECDDTLVYGPIKQLIGAKLVRKHGKNYHPTQRGEQVAIPNPPVKTPEPKPAAKPEGPGGYGRPIGAAA